MKRCEEETGRGGKEEFKNNSQGCATGNTGVRERIYVSSTFETVAHSPHPLRLSTWHRHVKAKVQRDVAASEVGWGHERNTLGSCKAGSEQLLPPVHQAVLHPEVGSLHYADEQAHVQHAWDHFDSCVHFTPFVDPVKLPVQDKVPTIPHHRTCLVDSQQKLNLPPNFCVPVQLTATLDDLGGDPLVPLIPEVL